jgi:hypothetical protein
VLVEGFLCCSRRLDVYADDPTQPRYFVIIPQIPFPDVYVLGAGSLDGKDLESLAGCLAELDAVGGFFVPINLVQPIRARLRIDVQVEGTWAFIHCPATVVRGSRLTA